MKTKVLAVRALVMAFTMAAINPASGRSQNNHSPIPTKEIHAMKTATEIIPSASVFTTAPLRNRIRIELYAPVTDIWALVGDVSRFPEYSSGLEKVVANRDSRGVLTDYVCHFKHRGQGGEELPHREMVRWYEANLGYISSGESDNAFGLTNDVNMVTVQPSAKGTILTWDEYYDAQDLDVRRVEYDEALTDIGDHLLRRFGGEVITRYVER